MDFQIKKLPDSELEIMLALWDAGQEAPRSYFDHQLQEKGWSITTINTYLSRLTEKGFLSCRKDGRMNYYTPLISREDYLSFERRSMLDRLYGSSMENFVAALCRDRKMDPQEIDRLQLLLEELKQGGDPHA